MEPLGKAVMVKHWFVDQRGPWSGEELAER